MERLRTALTDRYVLERQLGAGGMATVYLAHDLKHDRKVAVKVFRPELAAALGSERFFREIRITANLNHPHILPLLDSGRAVEPYGGKAVDEPGEFLYYVMPYVEGESLRQRLNREKQLSVDEALEITSQVASALSYAHSRDIVHRDIKPENILFQAGEVVVADFGIALAVDSAGGTRLTETGFSLGTPAYMSPEQVSGEQEIDGRSDIYSLACVLYEMLASDPPFVASNPRAVLAKHMTDPAPPITTVRASVPPPVAAAIAKALGKAPADRFDSAKGFSEALFAVGVEADQQKKSIVVLPFENLSPDPDNEYFSDGLTDEIITDLSRLHTLLVISRNSTMLLKGTTKDTKTIGHELNVQYVLSGSVRKAGDRLRVTAQLIDARNDAHLWADKYSGTVEDVFDMQERVSREIVAALDLTLTPEERRKIAGRPIDNVQAYECYHRAWNDVFTATKEGFDRALERIRKALDLVGDNETLYSAMGEAHFQAVNLMLDTNEDHLARVEECVDKILALNPDSAHAHRLIGAVLYKRGQVQEAVPHLKRAFEINPNDPVNAFYLAGICAFSGKTDVARVYARRMLELDPLTPLNQWWWAWVEMLAGNFEEAVEPLRRTYRTHPQDMPTAWSYAFVLTLHGRNEEAFQIIDEVVGREPDLPLLKQMIFLKRAIEGDEQMALELVTPEAEASWRSDEHQSWYTARCYALLNRTEEALDWLEHAAVKCGFINYPLLACHDPALDTLRGDPRFESLMARVKELWENFEV